MIVSFRSRALKRLYARDDDSRIDPRDRDRVRNILTLLDAALAIADLDVPGWRLHRLKGELRGYWALSVRANWRIVFRFEAGEVFDVDLVDYH